VHIRK